MDRRARWGSAAHTPAPLRLRLPVVAATAAALVLGTVGSLAPRSAALDTPGEQTWETGVVHHVSDGDTVAVDVTWASNPALIAPPRPADPSTPTATSFCDERLDADGTMPADGDLTGCRVRMIGLQAPETPKGSTPEQCGATDATDALRSVLPKGTRVRLRSIHGDSFDREHSGGRLLRSIYYQDPTGTWVDAARAVLGAGGSMWFPFNADDPASAESDHNLEYRRTVDGAMRARRGLWAADHCGRSKPANVRMWVVSDPIGSDVRAERVVVVNDASKALDISGWSVRDSSLVWFTFPSGTVIPAGDFVRVFTGSGTSGAPTRRDFHFGGPSMVFANWDPAAGYFFGDAAYLQDAQPGYSLGNMRAWFHYPCDPADCSDPLVGKVVMGTVEYNPKGTDTAAGEYVEFRNTTKGTIGLGGYAFGRRGSQYPFPPGTTIAAGATLRLSMGAGTDTRNTLFLGRAASLLSNSGDQLTLANLDHSPVDCRAWGSFTCSGKPVSGPLVTPGSAPTSTTNPSTPTTTDPGASTGTGASSRPGAPTIVRVRSKHRRIKVRWVAPLQAGTSSVTKYRAKAYVRSGKKLKARAKCTVSASTLKCRTKKLVKRKKYVVKVRARNKAGYGPWSARVKIRAK